MFLVKNSISKSTKKLLQKTLESIKNFIYGGYQKLPKSPRCNPNYYYHSCIRSRSLTRSCRDDLDRFYEEFINAQEFSQQNKNSKKRKNKRDKETKRRNIKESSPSQPLKQENDEEHGECQDQAQGQNQDIRGRDQESCFMGGDEKGLMVEEKVRELVKMDMRNVDHVLDIEEIIHYYSRLTCPVYVGIVEKFFMEIYAEFFGEDE